MSLLDQGCFYPFQTCTLFAQTPLGKEANHLCQNDLYLSKSLMLLPTNYHSPNLR